MSDITELAQMKGQKVEAPYYLAECTECGKMYPSSQLIESRNYMDGDADCYCPHCNATDPDIADCGSEGVTAWNYQQARIDALVEALEKAQQRANAAQDDHINQQQDRIDILERRNAELGGELSRYSMSPGQADQRMCESRAARDALGFGKDADDVAPIDLRERIDGMKARIAELESRTVTVNLPDIMPPEAAPAHYWGSGESMAYADGYNKSAADLKTSFAQACSSAGVNVEFE
ncbi:TPA: hypothetical protein L9R18_003306 [Klebsiella pneumoniae]|nr:hypothetical protein [Klebsiella pneumoniae]